MPTSRLIAILGALALALPASATTYVMMADEALVDQAPLVARVEMVDAESTSDGGATLYRARVLDVLKGATPASELTVRVVGGENAAGEGRSVWGVPRFGPGEEAVLFLAPRADGTFGILHLALGALHLREVDDRRVAIRQMQGAEVLGTAPGGERQGPRDVERFSSWVRDRAAGSAREADYFVELPDGALEQATGAYTFIRSPGVRWFEFDEGATVTWLYNPNGLALTAQDVNTALFVWNTVSNTNVDLVNGGGTGATGGLSSGGNDDLNVILGNDPNNEMSGTFSCSSGGVLAHGGPWFRSNTLPYNGAQWHRAVEGDVVFNNGIECFLNLSAPNYLRQILAHEIGHTLGLGHSCGDSDSPACVTGTLIDQALMRAQVHQDGRSAVLNDDDRSGLRQMYLESGGGGGGGGGGGTSGSKPAAPGGLMASPLSSQHVHLVWTDNSGNETSFRIERALGGSGQFAQVATVGKNVTSAVVGGNAASAAYAFRVLAVNSAGASGASNEAIATTFAQGSGCVDAGGAMCLGGDRFRASALFRPAGQPLDEAQSVRLTADTGYFWFFNADNVEAVLKVLDACDVPGSDHYWVFASGLTDVEVHLAVVDLESGQAWSRANSQGVPFQPIQDTGAFSSCP